MSPRQAAAIHRNAKKKRTNTTGAETEAGTMTLDVDRPRDLHE
jgi:hypothetical protein